jgi:hypothetical protein
MVDVTDPTKGDFTEKEADQDSKEEAKIHSHDSNHPGLYR